MKLVIKQNPTPYTLIERLLLPDEATVPEGYALSTEQDAQAWVDQQIANGWTPAEQPAPGPGPVPFEVGSGQIRAALVALGWVTIQNPSNADAEVDAWAAALIELAVQDPGQKAIALLLWRNASAFKCNNPFILLVATILRKTGEETDTLFRTAVNF